MTAGDTEALHLLLCVTGLLGNDNNNYNNVSLMYDYDNASIQRQALALQNVSSETASQEDSSSWLRAVTGNRATFARIRRWVAR